MELRSFGFLVAFLMVHGIGWIRILCMVRLDIASNKYDDVSMIWDMVDMIYCGSCLVYCSGSSHYGRYFHHRTTSPVRRLSTNPGSAMCHCYTRDFFCSIRLLSGFALPDQAMVVDLRVPLTGQRVHA